MLDVGSADARANGLRSCARDLTAAQQKLSQYKSMLGCMWQGTEMQFFHQAIGKCEASLSAAASALGGIAGDVSSVARQIRAEEEAAEKARREAEEKARREAEEKARQEAEAQKAAELARQQELAQKALAAAKRLRRFWG